MELKVVRDGTVQIRLHGRLDAVQVPHMWRQVSSELDRIAPKQVEIDATEVDYCDGCGISLLTHIQQRQAKQGGQVEIRGLKPKFQQLLTLFAPGPMEAPVKEGTALVRLTENVGRTATRAWQDLRAQVSFVGEIMVKLLQVLIRPRDLRWGDTLTLIEKSGADALGITAMLGFLIGLILAFQSSVAMKQFGAEVFVADLVVISLFRELGPLITAFVLASRSGSAFAAELGTMKINEEIDALTTMGLDPVQFLVLPRMIAGVVVLPVLTLFNCLFGLLGCAVVMLSMGYPMVTFIERIQGASGLDDLFGGLAKTLVFGFLIAGIGCLRGLQTRTGASAVGDSATRAVVSGIVAIVLADGVFAVLYNFVGI
jgi:phospholipid/cholesterol/gamma-HCH transport system permease protein